MKIEADGFKPLNDLVLIKKEFNDGKTAGGIIISAAGEQRPQSGHVIAVGDKVEFVKPGDRVHFHWAAGTTFELNNEQVSLLKEKDIFGILDKDCKFEAKDPRGKLGFEHHGGTQAY